MSKRNVRTTRKKPVKKRRCRKKPRKVRLTGYGIAAVIAVLIAIAIFIARPYIRDRETVRKGACVPEGYHCYGIDISKYQPSVEWDKIKVLTDAHGRTTNSVNLAKDIRNISYVFIKATEGCSMKDSHFKKHWRNAGRSGVRRGAYHFFRSSKDAEVQAHHFIRTVGDLSVEDLPPVLDIETIHKGCSYRTLNEKALIWLKAVEKHYGRKPVVYSSASFIENILCDEIKDRYPIWVAHYDAESPRCQRWHIWQFTDEAIIYGIEGHVDLNVTTELVLKSL